MRLRLLGYLDSTGILETDWKRKQERTLRNNGPAVQLRAAASKRKCERLRPNL